MAELVVINIAKSLLEQLSSPAKDELLLWFKSKSELEKFENTIITIKDVLQDAEEKGANSAAVQRWLLRLRDEMYKADDFFDTISTRALQKRVMAGNELTKEMRIFFSKSNHLAFTVTTAHKVKEFRKRLDGIAKDINQFGFIRITNEDERTSMKRNRQTHSYVPNDAVIGREKDKEEMIKLLLADTGVEEGVSVIAVVGIGGLGKTALAQLLYDTTEIKDFFKLRLWACVNDFSNLKEALEKITASGTEERPIDLQLDQLKDKLWKRIHARKFLLVLDDVWSDIREQWLSLKVLLDVGKRGSKILLTTRSMTVSKNLATVRPYYALGELSDEHAWLLFKKMAFDSNQEVENQEKEELGRQIMKKCPNVPLAIRTIASFLYNKDKKQWLAFLDNALSKVMPNAENMIMQALRISYNDMSPSLKHCFAYCSLFPKDYVFDKTTLFHLWMAQGLLQTSTENECLEDVAESYFFSLIDRCFFHNVMVDGDGHIVGCKMHDLLHDLAVEIAGNECRRITNLDDFRGKSCRHLLVRELRGSPLQCEGTRSLVVTFAGSVEIPVLNGLFMNLTSLRSLSLRHLDIEELPSSIGKLIHLRHVDLRRSEKLSKISDALCKLQNLLILRLGGCSNLIKLPDGLEKLISLRYLEIKGCDKLNHIPSGLKEMSNLVMLDRLVVDKDHGGLRYLKCLNNLTGHIDIKFPRGRWKNCVADAEESMLRNKTRLTKLVLSWDDPTEGEDMPEADVILDKLQPSTSIDHLRVANFVGVKFPNWLSSLENIVDLALEGCSKCVELPNLRKLFHLKRLKLFYIPLLEYLENGDNVDDGPFFPLLQSLDMEGMSMLKGWWRPVGKDMHTADNLWFPRLSYLRVTLCPELTLLPLYPSVEKVILNVVNVNLLRRLGQRAPNAVELEANISLRSLRLYRINDLAFMLDELVQMSALRQLDICGCPNFEGKSLFYLLQHLHALEYHAYKGSLETDLFADENQENDGMRWMSLTKLKSLDFEFGSDRQGARLFRGIHHLTSLDFLAIYKDLPHDNYTRWKAPPNVLFLVLNCMNEVSHLNSVIQQLKKLQTLTIRQGNIDEHELDKLSWEDFKGLRSLKFTDMKMIKSLPDTCRRLPALERLEITRCPELTAFPDWVSNLTSLTITDCPILKDKCRKPLGSFWPLVQSIPSLQFPTSSERDNSFRNDMRAMSYSDFSRHNR